MVVLCGVGLRTVYNGALSHFRADAAQQPSCVMYYVYLIGGNGHSKFKICCYSIYTIVAVSFYVIATKFSPVIYAACTAVASTMTVHEGRVPPLS